MNRRGDGSSLLAVLSQPFYGLPPAFLTKPRPRCLDWARSHSDSRRALFSAHRRQGGELGEQLVSCFGQVQPSWWLELSACSPVISKTKGWPHRDIKRGPQDSHCNKSPWFTFNFYDAKHLARIAGRFTSFSCFHLGSKCHLLLCECRCVGFNLGKGILNLQFAFILTLTQKVRKFVSFL